MVFWGRIWPSRVEYFSYQCKRWYSQIYGISMMNGVDGGRRSEILRHWKTSEQYAARRSFAAPVQAKPKPETKDLRGPRLNKAITSEFVRLVTDEGHSVVSRREALDRAMKLKLDLVEVHRNSKPPVCKIMDYHREVYKQQLKEKDRLKSKSASTLRKGDCKEVRFTRKTEQKDLQIKADTIKRLMERGYRVKCMAMGTEEEDLGGLLSRLSALIEDVAFVESGPRVEKRQAYAVVRHIKFGSTKKSPGKKAAKIVEATTSEVQKTATSPTKSASTSPAQTPSQIEEEFELTESGSETEGEILSDQEEVHTLDSSETLITTPIEQPEEFGKEKAWSAFDADNDFEKVFGFDGDNRCSTSRFMDNGSVDSVDVFPSREDTADVIELLSKNLPITSVVEPDRNRGRDLGMNTSTGPPGLKQIPDPVVQRGQINNSRLSVNDLPGRKIQSPNPKWQPQPSVDATPYVAQNLKNNDSSSLRNVKPPSNDESRKQAQVDMKQGPSLSGYGIFSALKTATSSDQKTSTVVNTEKERNSMNPVKSPDSSGISSNPNPLKPVAKSPTQDADKTRQGGWGIFSGETSSPNQHRTSDSQMKAPR